MSWWKPKITITGEMQMPPQEPLTVELAVRDVPAVAAALADAEKRASDAEALVQQLLQVHGYRSWPRGGDQ